MSLKSDYFAEKGPHPADDIGQGYLTVTFAAEDLPTEILEAARRDPSLLQEFEPDETLLKAVARETLPASFKMFRNNEVAFDESGDVGYLGFGLDVAFSEELKVALVAYTGPGVPIVVRRYECFTPDEAVATWQLEWSAPLNFSDQTTPQL